MTEAPRSRVADILLAVAAFVLGATRGLSLPMTSDAGFHLVRAGNGLLSASLEGFRTAPGGLHAPLLGSAFSALGALPGGGESETALLIPGALLLGAACALLAWPWTRRADRTVAVLALALVLLPPAIAASFTLRPDAALAGTLL
ncbi:MAG TPA: hypothetical protein VKU85_17300, partial [bacterium]|nr:hypothetical protein [bacterium]